jgi:hypothetical protein
MTVLYGEDAINFLKQVHENENKPVRLTPTPKLHQAEQLAREYTQKVLIDNNKLHKKCLICGHEDDIRGAVAIQIDKTHYNIIYGSDADFCTKCGETW